MWSIEKLIRCIVVGAGRIALSHLPHILKHSELELVAIVEPSLIARFIFKRLSGVRVVSSIDKIDKADFDAAFIFTPPSSHFSIAYPIIDEGKHIFLEKPLTLCPQQSEQLVNLAVQRGVQFSVGYVYRFHPVYIKLKQLLNSSDYGEIQTGEITMLGNVVSEATPKTWRNVGLGSGCIFDYGCHVIDLSLFLFGRPNETLCVDKSELFQKGVVDKFQAKLRYSGDDQFDLNIFCNWADSSVRKAGITIVIKTNENSLWSDGQLIRIRGKMEADYSIKDLDTDVPYYLRGEEFQNQLDHFATRIVTNKLCYAAPEDAAVCDAIISKLHESKL